MTPEEKRRVKRTSELKIAVALGVSQWGKNAALEMVPVWACEEGLIPIPTYRELARSMKVNHSNLWICLSYYNGEPRHNVRAKLESFLDLSTGGMYDVLAILEKL